MPTPVGAGYRGATHGRTGYLLRQAVHAFHTAMEHGLRGFDLSSAQYGALFVLAEEDDLSSADLARAMGVTAQAASLLVAGMEREGLVVRRPHPTHGRIVLVGATPEGARRFAAAQPFVTALEARITDGFGDRQLATIKRWLVEVAARCPGPRAPRGAKPTG